MSRFWMPTGVGPVSRRMLGLSTLLGDATLRLRSLVAVASDIADGVVNAPDDDEHAVLRMIIGSVSAELATLDMLTDRVKDLAIELSKDTRR